MGRFSGPGQDQTKSEAPHDSRTTDSLDTRDCVLHGDLRCDSAWLKRCTLTTVCSRRCTRRIPSEPSNIPSQEQGGTPISPSGPALVLFWSRIPDLREMAVLHSKRAKVRAMPPSRAWEDAMELLRMGNYRVSGFSGDVSGGPCSTFLGLK